MKYLISIVLVMFISACTTTKTITAPTVALKETPLNIPASVYEECSTIPTLEDENLGAAYIDLLILYSDCAMKQKTSVRILRILTKDIDD